MCITLGLYDDNKSTCFDYVQKNIPDLKNYSIEIHRFQEDPKECDIYCISTRCKNSIEIIRNIRKRSLDTCIIACCDDNPDLLRQLCSLKVDAICPYECDKVMETISHEADNMLGYRSIEDSLRIKLQKLEDLKTMWQSPLSQEPTWQRQSFY